MKLLCSVLFVSLFALTSCLVQEFGKCPDYTPVASLNLTAYMGIWYEIQRYPTASETGLYCAYAEYTLIEDPNGDYVKVNNSAYNGEEYTNVLGKLTQPNPPEGAFFLTFKDFPLPANTPNYNLLAVDTEEYALVYSCTEILNRFHFESAWILGRDRTLDKEVLQKLRGILWAIGSDPDNFIQPSQDNCP